MPRANLYNSTFLEVSERGPRQKAKKKAQQEEARHEINVFL